MDKKQTNKPKRNREWTIGPKQTKIEQKYIYKMIKQKRTTKKCKAQTGPEKNRFDLSFVFSIAFLYTAFYKQTSKQMTEKKENEQMEKTKVRTKKERNK